MYYGHAKTESLLVEANRALSDVQLSTIPGGLTQPRHRFEAKLPSIPTEPQEQQGYADEASNVWSSEDASKNLPSPTVTTGIGGSFFHPPPSSQSQPSSPFSHAPQSRQGTVDDFGILPTRSSGSGPIDIGGGGGGGGKFATFPVKTREGGVGYALRDEPLSAGATQPPSLNTNTRHELGLSFSMSVAEALGSGVEDQPWARTTTTMGDGPMPTSAIRPLPPGAAPASPEGVDPWSLPPLSGGAGRGGGLLGLGTPGQTLNTPGQGGKQGRHVSNQSIVSDDDDALLAYMLNADADDGDGHRRSLTGRPLSGYGGGGGSNVGGGAGAGATPAQPAAATPANGSATQAMDEDREREQSRHVRFGGSELSEVEEWKQSLEERRSDAGQVEVDHGQGSFRLVSLSCWG